LVFGQIAFFPMAIRRGYAYRAISCPVEMRDAHGESESNDSVGGSKRLKEAGKRQSRTQKTLHDDFEPDRKHRASGAAPN
jgi:hypothetical protein